MLWDEKETFTPWSQKNEFLKWYNCSLHWHHTVPEQNHAITSPHGTWKYDKKIGITFSCTIFSDRLSLKVYHLWPDSYMIVKREKIIVSNSKVNIDFNVNFKVDRNL